MSSAVIARSNGLKRSLQNRSFHSSIYQQIKNSKNGKIQQTDSNESLLLNKSTSNFTLLSYKTLKDECKKRGLTVSGKKLDLVNRLHSFESTHPADQSRHMTSSSTARAKNDSSTIDSYKMPSQASINEWEYKYDYSRVPSTKVPAITKKAVKEDAIKEQKIQEILKDDLKSVKVEANDAVVVHSGAEVAPEPEYINDKYSHPVDTTDPDTPLPKTPKVKNSEKYVQSSLNPLTNHTEIVNLGGNTVSNTIASEVSSTPTPIVEDPHTEMIQDSKSDILSKFQNSKFYKEFTNPQESFKDEKYTYEEGGISSRDRTILLSIIGVSGIWWFFKPKNESK